MLGGVHVCLRQVEAQAILAAMREHGVDHYCAAPIVHNLLINAPAEWRAGITHKVRGMVAGAAPPAAMIEGMAKLGFDITHVYGLTEVYGPAAVAVKRESVGRREPVRADAAERPPGRALRAAGRHDACSTPTRSPKCRPTARPWARSCSAAIS